MNIKKLFDASEAKLYNLLNKESDFYISSAIQKAFIEVNEEGAEAAAANGMYLQTLNKTTEKLILLTTY